MSPFKPDPLECPHAPSTRLVQISDAAVMCCLSKDRMLVIPHGDAYCSAAIDGFVEIQSCRTNTIARCTQSDVPMLRRNI
ncbi:MAG: hypothetical protein M3O62_11695 [Pseudomonadota bacterium]|nr:hypothetical protein [Pseudomonadota bacterium]